MSLPLVLIPSELELEAIRKTKYWCNELQQAAIWKTCGIGIIQSGIEAANLLAELKPTRVLLLGIAGSIGNSCQIGEVVCGSSVRLFGVGVGSGKNFQPVERTDLAKIVNYNPILMLDSSSVCQVRTLATGSLLSVTAVSCDEAEVGEKVAAYPDVVAEDMESYAVAVACAQQGIGFSVLRGISNVAGVRDKSQWQISKALLAVAEVACDVLQHWSIQDNSVGRLP